MRVTLLLTTSARSFFLRGGPWLTIGLIWNVPETPVLAAEAPDNRISRLGFTFDQRAHDAAVAAEAQRRAGTALEADAPPPGVIRLPKHVVTGERVPLDENEMLTPKGRLEAARKRYLSPMYQKTIGPLAAVVSLIANPLGGWNPNGPEAMVLYEQDEKLRREGLLKDLSELAELADQAKKAEADAAAGRAKNTRKQ